MLTYAVALMGAVNGCRLLLPLQPEVRALQGSFYVC
jgi:hypothetical protein